MSKTMILAVGGAGCNMAETIMRVANAHWVKEATYLFADSDMERLSELGKKGFETLSIQCDSDSFPTDKLQGVEKLYILAGLGGVTGSKFAEIAAKVAQSDGVENVALIVTIPSFSRAQINRQRPPRHLNLFRTCLSRFLITRN